MKKPIAWITGAGTGIGRALAIQMAHDGYRVALSGRRQSCLDEVAQVIKAQGGQADVFVCDVANQAQVENTAAQIVNQLGGLDTCVANAGFGVYSKFEQTTVSQWRRQMDVNFFGAVWTMQAALPYLKQSAGRLVVVSSIASRIAAAKTAAYSASKFALNAVCDALYQELQGTGVSITNILPGFVVTDLINVDNDGNYRSGEDFRPNRPNYLAWPADRAVKVIAQAIEQRRREAIITGHAKVADFLMRYMPSVTLWCLARRRLR